MIVDLGNDRVSAALVAIQSDKASGISADVTDAQQVANYAKHAADVLGAVDIFFNNAGTAGAVAPIVDYPEAAFDAVLAVNVRGVFLGMKHLLPRMADGGSIMITSSIAGLGGHPASVGYVASKHAVVGIMRTAAQEAAPRRIRVNTIHPGPVEGEMMRFLERGHPGTPEAVKAMALERIRFGRYLNSEEVADLVAFLASDESRMITGSTITIDGGRSV